ncbi:hypothetical protein A9Q91_05580 [Candidatus Gracilibacteria bacterium 28_42_T64]|nr:hypothetical protein A9Q91_05580 [Candidatus Gracilibacteria bacterium 28_42_T64]
MENNQEINQESVYEEIISKYSDPSRTLRKEDIEASRKDIRKGYKYLLLLFLITVSIVIKVFFNNELIAAITYLKDLLLFTILPYIMEIYSELSLGITFP